MAGESNYGGGGGGKTVSRIYTKQIKQRREGEGPYRLTQRQPGIGARPQGKLNNILDFLVFYLFL